MDTVFALASARGKAGVAVIRISGQRAHFVARQLAHAELPDRGMKHCVFRTPAGERVDDGLALMFQAPHSFTGEDIAELQIHGSAATISRMLGVLSEIDGLRLAEPGEFTRRALENGKMDLTQVEGLADLIDAETEEQRKQAHVILSGGLGDIAEKWRTYLIRAASLLEAVIDFADEDVPTDVTPEVIALLSNVLNDLVREISGVKMAERIRTGFEVAIIGPPNAGKSTLLNALAGRDAAITSEFAGTTRDVIEVRMDLMGIPVTLLDTAGLRDTEDHVENIGITRAIERAESADLRVFLVDNVNQLPVSIGDSDIHVRPKADQHDNAVGYVSGKTGAGLNELVAEISEKLSDKISSRGIATRERHRVSMAQAKTALEAATDLLAKGPDYYDITAEEIRVGIRALESLVGRIDVENLLDEIFSSFCLGK